MLLLSDNSHLFFGESFKKNWKECRNYGNSRFIFSYHLLVKSTAYELWAFPFCAFISSINSQCMANWTCFLLLDAIHDVHKYIISSIIVLLLSFRFHKGVCVTSSLKSFLMILLLCIKGNVFEYIFSLYLHTLRDVVNDFI